MLPRATLQQILSSRKLVVESLLRARLYNDCFQLNAALSSVFLHRKISTRYRHKLSQQFVYSIPFICVVFSCEFLSLIV